MRVIQNKDRIQKGNGKPQGVAAVEFALVHSLPGAHSGNGCRPQGRAYFYNHGCSTGLNRGRLASMDADLDLPSGMTLNDKIIS